MKIRILLLALAGSVLLAAAAWLSAFTVTRNEYVIVTQFGRTVRTLGEPGLYFKLPGFLQTVNRLDGRLHIFKTEPTQMMLGDKNPLIPTCFICWRIADPELFFQRLRTVENAEGKIRTMVGNALGTVLGEYELADIINTDPAQVKLDEIENRIRRDTRENARSEYGVEIVRVGLRRLAYPAIVENSIYNRMRAEREKEARKFRAEGKEEADKIEAETDRDVAKIMAEAYRTAEARKGDGDREAMRIYAEAYGKDPEFYEFLTSLELYKQTLQENATLILSTGSDLFKHLVETKGGDALKKAPVSGSGVEGEGEAK